MQRFQVSERFVSAVRTAGTPQYRLALRGGFARNAFSGVMGGLVFGPITRQRVERIGQTLGLDTSDCVVVFDEPLTPRPAGFEG